MKRADILETLKWHPAHVEDDPDGLLARIERVVALAEAAEREACAQTARTAMLGAAWVLTERVMNAIRARSQT